LERPFAWKNTEGIEYWEVGAIKFEPIKKLPEAVSPLTNEPVDSTM
jgi:hypothetical protein